MKEKLKENKIYFETAVAAALGVMALIVSAAHLWTAIHQTKVASAQLEVARYQVSPQIHLTAEFIRSPETYRVEAENIVVRNFGGPAQEAKARHVVFLEVELTSLSAPFHTHAVEIALSDYYGGTVVHQAVQGPMFTIMGYRNTDSLSKLIAGLRALAAEDGYYSDVLVNRYVEISYSDVFRNRQTLYFSVASLHGGAILPNVYGEERFASHRNLFGTAYYRSLGSLTPQVIFDLLLDSYDRPRG